MTLPGPTVTSDARPLNLICTHAALDTILETTFIVEVLLGGLKRSIRIRPFPGDGKIPIMNDGLFLVLNSDLVPVVRHAIRAGCRNIGVLHMGDEFYTSDRSYYGSVDYVLRNYYKADTLELPPNARCRQALWIPNGYRSGLEQGDARALLAHQHREQLVVFAGCLTTGGQGLEERGEMMEVVKAMDQPATMITTQGFGLGLAASAYAALMQNARFALVPGGRNAETIRLYDALEAGAIPITLRHAFLERTGPIPDAPFVFLDSWRDLPGWLRANTGGLHDIRNVELQRKCLDWWSSVKRRCRTRVAALIDASFGEYPTTCQ